ncbi:hypothetical protein BCR34DRAFT_660057 [Clohesyomyces aquaticus]|uniref:GmrSD restriction endonucleases N-terminal domain-containing protein n=1 Tax=Clohesyomyces aquaticus TaxID=1231657 RepID=A0A1Y2A849_9PLEO|nr:hypothetical protein BCR34DRAFT_660057 [Clohesyomyces aquaticus]
MAANQAQASIKDEDDDRDEFFDDDENEEFKYKSRPKLPIPFTVMRTLGDLVAALDAGSIDVNPDYQREVVWTAERMSGLINSLMENYYIPPIILNKKEFVDVESGAPTYSMVCVDGKQRLSSVKAFIRGMIPCHDYRGDKWWFVDPANKPSKKILPEITRNEFLSKELVSTEFVGLSPEQEEDLFARVQMGMQLNLAEKMRASSGPWQELAKLFVNDFSLIFTLLKDRARSKDFQLVLSCFSQIMEVEHPTTANGVPTLKTNYKALPKLLDNKAAVDDQSRSHLANTFATFKQLVQESPEIFTNVERKLKGVQTFAPLEFVSVSVLISMYSHTRNNKMLIGDIRALRNALRDNFVDLRLNISCWKFVWEWLDNLEAYRGTVEGTAIDRSVRPQAPPNPVPRQQAAEPSAVTAKRRGRPTARPEQPSFTAANAAEAARVGNTPKRQRVEAETPEQWSRERVVSQNEVVYPPFPGFSGVGSSTVQPLVLDDAEPSTHSRGAPVITSTIHTPSISQPAPRYSANLPPVSGFNPINGHAPQGLFTPPEARHNRVQELNSSRAPIATMSSIESPNPSSQRKPTSPILMLPHHTSQVPRQQPPQTRPSQPAQRSRPPQPTQNIQSPQSQLSSPMSTTQSPAWEDQLQAVLNASASTPPEEPRSPQPQQEFKYPPPRHGTSNKIPSRASDSHLDGVIDLTDEGDIERVAQDLLLSFAPHKTKPVNENISKAMKNISNGNAAGHLSVAGAKRERSNSGEPLAHNLLVRNSRQKKVHGMRKS